MNPLTDLQTTPRTQRCLMGCVSDLDLLDDLVAEVPGAAPPSNAGQTEGVAAGG